jgi:hypothetical protein
MRDPVRPLRRPSPCWPVLLVLGCASQQPEPAGPFEPEPKLTHPIPPPVVEHPPPNPRLDVYWRPGYWYWSDGAWTWDGGQWLRWPVPPMPPPRHEHHPPPPDDTSIWIPGHWVFWRPAWVWIPGHWEEPMD